MEKIVRNDVLNFFFFFLRNGYWLGKLDSLFGNIFFDSFTQTCGIVCISKLHVYIGMDYGLLMKKFQKIECEG